MGCVMCFHKTDYPRRLKAKVFKISNVLQLTAGKKVIAS